ncbi:hypothetical protein AC062_0199 [Pasteurellaceae bacterium NI1060]|nr:hypothetical protein AC062_0199 [Pasteurellaceae bacterium NI1060]
MGFNFFTHFYLVKTLKLLTALLSNQEHLKKRPSIVREALFIT